MMVLIGSQQGDRQGVPKEALLEMLSSPPPKEYTRLH